MQNKQNTLTAIRTQGLLPLFFHPDVEVCLETVKTLYSAGVRTLEFTNRGPEALENFTFLKNQLKASHPDLHIGIGTVKTVEDANAFLKADADFIVSPIVNPAVATIVHEAGMLWIPGCMTPTEIFSAQQNNAALVKIFPANILGPAFVSSVKELFPGQLFMPTGGVEIERENIRNWFKSGVCAVGMGSKLISKDVLENKSYDSLLSLTAKALQLVKSERE
ncbi:bifunctional 4-hydroxy-2-oxoglutarate aldolase/2-dehydro-3-deoxy-phosphogluconate aldolase [Rubrolithibacter danxiaensis]|uniref:bifunctional 4-hydroxy-2-oxoglutarate aldolase/2-dehydro-3-deoxy-phosphogluconate aldolase n=1 Tax=Rubrolithibacter danxiaensis TaxID=3390805 RepID=UPI003BF8E094